MVELFGTASPECIELAINDGYGGLGAEDLARVFDVAWQGSAVRNSDALAFFGSGAGLGLAIVKGIVEAHHGTVSVANSSPGCQFRVKLPTGAVPWSSAVGL